MTPSDTTPEAAAAQAGAWRSMSGPERAALALQMSDDLRGVSLSGLARRRPRLGPDERVRDLIRRMHGIEVDEAPPPL